MRIKVEEVFGNHGQRHVQFQVAEGKKWHDFGYMNHVEREELAAVFKQFAKELLKVQA